MKLEPQKIDSIFTEWDKTSSPGCALAVIKDGEIIYKRGYGMANLECGLPVSTDTRFYIASISKQFTAMAIALLIREGKLTLDDEIHQYLPELKDYGVPLTLRHLLHHTSGIRDEYELLWLAGWREEDATTTADFLELLSLQEELNFKPGSEWVYSNSNYTLLAIIVERISGKSMYEFCRERLFKSLGMQHTHFHEDFTRLVPHRASSYAPAAPGSFTNVILTYGTAGDTGIFTTVEDMALWDQEFYDGKVVGKEVIEMMHTEGFLNDGKATGYAFGLALSIYRGLKTVGHGGSDGGYRSHLLRFPQQHFSVVILCNLSTMQPGVLTHKVADLYLEEVFTRKAEFSPDQTPVTLSREQLEEKAGLYYNRKTKTYLHLDYKDGILLAGMGPGLPLEALAPDSFRIAPIPSLRICFEGLILKAFIGFEEPDIYEKVEADSPTTDRLSAFAGTYFSPELNISWEIVLKENQLLIKRRKYPTTPLRPAAKDAFTNPLGGYDIQFERGPHGNPTGFRLSTGRIRNLKFNKTA